MSLPPSAVTLDNQTPTTETTNKKLSIQDEQEDETQTSTTPAMTKSSTSSSSSSSSLAISESESELPKDMKSSSSGEMTTTPSSLQESLIRLEFADYTDLQTRLVLLPRVENEGIGAVVSSYVHPEPSTPTAPPTGESSNEEGKEGVTDELQKQDGEATYSGENRDDEETMTDHSNLTGCVLIGMESKREENWKDMDFTDILATIREEGDKSFVLIFEPEDSSKLDSPPATPPQTPPAEKAEKGKAVDDKPENQETVKTGMMALSAWGMRMRAQAADAANNAAAIASAALKQQQEANKKANSNRSDEKLCDVFLQTSVGAFIPVASAQSMITTSSLVIVRKSATEACPTSGISFQWYRSSSPTTSSAVLDDSASISSRSRASTITEVSGGDDIEWIPLEGATHAAFQPNTTLVGRRIRCIVQIEQEDKSDDSSNDDMDDVDLNSVDAQEVVCEIQNPITADNNLFNSARQALVRGAKFGGLLGRGNAEGRKFRLEVSIGMIKRRKKMTSSVKIFQLSGNDGQALTDTPILQVAAGADASKPKLFHLILPPLPETSVLNALCTDGVLQFEAPNRVSRESFLLALGIANYTGKPAKLDTKTILYKDELKIARSLFDDDLSSVASSSNASLSASSVHSYSSRSVSSAASSLSPDGSSVHCVDTSLDRVSQLEKELEFMRSKLARKDKVVSELQRQITRSDSAYQQTKQILTTTQQALQRSKSESLELSQSLASCETKLRSKEAEIKKIQDDNAFHVSALEDRIMSQSEKIAELEKSSRSLQNEKAVLSAAVEARESKLVKMSELQESFHKLSEQVTQQDAMRVELEESNKRYLQVQGDLERVTNFEKECRNELEQAKEKVESLTKRMKGDEERVAVVNTELDKLQKANQKLKGERNNYKQKNDSLSKEISRICRSGRSIKDIEKIIADHQALKDEAEVLRLQKRKALEDAHQYRTSYEQSKVAQEMAGVDTEIHKALERNAELERLLAEMAEYVNAKEMQLETMKLVNEHLQTEIHSLAQASLKKDEI